MRLEKIALLAEIVGGIAIVISLAILSAEVRSNTDAIRAQTISSQRIADSERRGRIISDDGGISDLIIRARDVGDLTVTETFRVDIYYLDMIRNWEWQFGEADAGRLPYDRLDTRAWRIMWVGQPKLRDQFASWESDLDPNFVEYFLGVIETTSE